MKRKGEKALQIRRKGLFIVAVWIVTLVAHCAAVPGQEKPALPPPTAEETAQAQKSLQEAVNALGGEAYEAVKTEVSHGFFTPFEAGRPNSGGFFSFTDSMVFPDKERVEFKNGKHRIIQVNTGDKGWRYDNESPVIVEQSQEDIVRYGNDLRCQLDNLLRQERRRKGLKLRYEPNVPAAKFQHAEAVTFIFTDGTEAKLLLDQATHRPLMVRYAGTAASDGSATQEETRFLQYHAAGNLTLPFVLDHYVNSEQTNRINYDRREFNLPVDEKLFAHPASLKEIK